jgi:L-lactate utilization protein LutC
MSAREKILARIAVANRKPDKEVLSHHLATHPRGPKPPDFDDLKKRFAERAIKLSSDVLETEDRNQIPDLIADYLKQKSLPMKGVCWPALSHLQWVDAGLEIEARSARDSDMVGITGAFCAIAETGTLLLLGGDKTPASVSLLPETHVAIVDPERIVATMEDAWDLMRREFGEPPRTVNFISGPSRTADIEQTVTLGAHGPYRVLVILAA